MSQIKRNQKIKDKDLANVAGGTAVSRAVGARVTVGRDNVQQDNASSGEAINRTAGPNATARR